MTAKNDQEPDAGSRAAPPPAGAGEDAPGQFAHLDAQGRVQMVDVGHKQETERLAVARGRIWMAPATRAAIERGSLAKGDALAVARVAGIMAAKQTGAWLPLCHPLRLTGISIAFRRVEGPPSGGGVPPDWLGLEAQATVTTRERTGVEMEALTAVSAALLTIYDMCKGRQRDLVIDGVRLIRKQGGRSGSLDRPGEPTPAAFRKEAL